MVLPVAGPASPYRGGFHAVGLSDSDRTSFGDPGR